MTWFHVRLWELLEESGNFTDPEAATACFLIGLQAAFVSPEWGQAALHLVDEEGWKLGGLPMREGRERAARGLISGLPVEVAG